MEKKVLFMSDESSEDVKKAKSDYLKLILVGYFAVGVPFMILFLLANSFKLAKHPAPKHFCKQEKQGEKNEIFHIRHDVFITQLHGR